MSTYIITRIDDIAFKRLVLAKQLYQDALQRTPTTSEIGRMISIHQLDAVIELVLKCILPFFRKSTDGNNKDHTAYWQTIDNILLEYSRPCLPLKQEISMLRDAKDSIHLYGIVADALTVHRHATFVGSFMKIVFKDIFGLDFKTISMSWIM